MMDNQDDIVELLANNEDLIAILYSTYAERILGFQEFWTNLAAEGKEHAAGIRALKDRLKDGKVFVNRSRFQEEAINVFSKYLNGRIAEAKKSELSQLNALSVAWDIENSVLEKKYFEVFATDSVEIRQLLSKLEAETARHGKIIREAWGKHQPGFIV